MNNLLTVEEVKNFLSIDEDQVEKYLKQGKLNAYKIGGTYLRFRKEEVINLRFEIQPHKINPPGKSSFFSHAADFWRFNNFYILSVILVLVVLVVIFKAGF